MNHTGVETLLSARGIRPTRHRVTLARLLLDGPYRHVTVEGLHREAVAAGARMSLATVYNTLHQLTAAGLLREVVVAPERTWFDTHTGPHHHFYDASTGELTDAPAELFPTIDVPVPAGKALEGVDIVVRVRPAS